MSIYSNEIKSIIDSYSDTIKRYHTQDDLMRKAEQLVPISELLERQPDINMDNDDEFRESLLPLVVDWFANEFFSWFDQPECGKCTNNPAMIHRYKDRQGGLAVECYQCPNFAYCGEKCEFTRYNDPGKLLETRTGRCGEWANCFMLILISLNFDSRIVVDVTDHVWCEVWSERQQCWIHVDPGEGIDRPLVYEAGWKKKLTYCIAVSPYEVQDVTWRYVIDLDETCRRRVLCNEGWLSSYLIRFTEILLSSYSDGFRNKVRDRKLRELASFIRPPGNTIKKVDFKELAQRKTGSLAWRMARGEFNTEILPHNIITIRKNIISNSNSNSDTGSSSFNQSCKYHLKYNCCLDVYSCTDDAYSKSKWSSIIYEAKNVERKFERDWKKSYIARYESCPVAQIGEITWRFNLKEIKNEWTNIKITLNGQIYPDTNIDISFVGHQDSTNDRQPLTMVKKIQHNQVCKINSSDINSEKDQIDYFDIKARLSGSMVDDEASWQKPQLFRQCSKTQQDMNSFVIEIY